MERFTNRWLLLDQETDCSQWTDQTCRCLTWNESGITPWLSAYPNSNPAANEICILFLPTSYDILPLPDSYTNLISWQWNVWCHYGRDITMAELKSRWASYERLSVADKSHLSRDGTRPPLPFSRSMRQPWSDDFDQIKKKVRHEEDFRKCLGLLQHAWNLAKGAQGTQVYVDQAREAMPAVLAGQYLLDSLPALAGWDDDARREAIDKALSLCQQSGLMALANRKERFSEPVRDAYRHLGFTVFRLRSLQQCRNLPVSAGELESLRAALRSFLKAAKAEAERTTKTLAQHP
jgi:hypothetical protein